MFPPQHFKIIDLSELTTNMSEPISDADKVWEISIGDCAALISYRSAIRD
jgi:hypothetical protein